MVDASFDRLTALDRSFLDIEEPNLHMHVGSVAIFDGGDLETDLGGIDIERIRAYIVSRLHRVPRYLQRIAHTPIEQHAVWVDDPHFNINDHVRHKALPRPGDERQLKRLAGRGQLFWGFNADWDTMPDLHDLVEDVEAAFASFEAAAGLS